MTTVSGTCSYVADVGNFEEWGGMPYNWSGVLDKMGVEGETWNCPHEAFDGQEYCPFHTAPEELPEAVDERGAVLAAIEASTGDEPDSHRRREFVEATFEVGFEFHGRCPFDFVARLMAVTGDVDLGSATIDRGVTFGKATIEGLSYFGGVTIEGETGEPRGESPSATSVSDRSVGSRRRVRSRAFTVPV